MKYCLSLLALAATLAVTSHAVAAGSVVDPQGRTLVLEPGHASLADWKLGPAPFPADNEPTAARIELGKKLFFDTRLSGDGTMSCGTCHNPMFGWSDGQPTARGWKGQVLGRATPTVVNTAYNGLQMWDGRKKSLEDQAMGPMEASVEMNSDLVKVFGFLGGNADYKALFAAAYPGEPIGPGTVAKAIASFERTVVSADTAFDRWVGGERTAMSDEQVKGFAVFVDAKKGNCAACHNGANFTDNGFHNLGLASFGKADADMGRFAQKALPVLKGAFKTPTIREAANTAPYFHDGSARTLMEVVEHYDRGGDVRTNVSKDVRPLNLTAAEKRQLVSFMEALSTPPKVYALPALPR